MQNGLGFLVGDDYSYSSDGYSDYSGGGGSYYSDWDWEDYAIADEYYSDWDWEDYYEAGGGPVADSYVELPTFDTDSWYVKPNYGQEDLYQAYRDAYSIDESVLDPAFFEETTRESGLPNQSPWNPVPYFPDYNIPSVFPPIQQPQAPQAPLPQSPAYQQSNLPPACPQGQYHPYPIGHPQQNICVPFPAAQAPQQPKAQTQQPGSGSSGSKPQQQQPKCPEYCRDPRTGQWFRTPAGYKCDPATQACTPIQQQCPAGQVRNPATGQCVTVQQCSTPGTVFDARQGRCVPFNQAQQPLCPPGYWPNLSAQRCEPIPACSPGLVFDVSKGLCVNPADLSGDGDILNSLASIPWWLWAALGAFLLLGRNGEERKKVTVQHRRAS